MKRRIALLLLLCIFTIAASGMAPANAMQAKMAITFDTEIRMLRDSAYVLFKAPEAGQTPNVSATDFIYASGAPDIASVDAQGIITAKQVGDATISITDKQKQAVASCTVHVVSVRGWLKTGDTYYYADENGSIATGWKRIQNTWYYFNANGAMQAGWVKWNGQWYYLKDNGAMAVGWVQSKGRWYYLKDSGAMATGWVKWNGQWYYLESSGAMSTGWVKWNGQWYYLKDSGAMTTGWLKWKAQWYYLKSNGAMATGWVKDKSWYYLQSGGAMKTGWLKEGKNWYYLKDNGVMATGWYQYNGKWYYSYASGVMAASTLIEGYRLGADGAWIQNNSSNKTLRIGIDPGHQSKANRGQEPVAPGSSVTKDKVSSGTQGRTTGVAEYVVNLQVGLQLRDALQKEGVEVVMSRTGNDVNISNKERAELFNKANVDLVIRLHCDGNDDTSKNGVSVLVPSNKCTQSINAESRAAAECALKQFVAYTGAKSQGIKPRDDQTGFNWSTVPVYNIEMGFMTNSVEDKKLVSADYQKKIVQGIVAGIHDYFK